MLTIPVCAVRIGYKVYPGFKVNFDKNADLYLYNRGYMNLARESRNLPTDVLKKGN